MNTMTKISFTEKHLRILETALEVYMRLRNNQFDIALEEAFPDVRLDHETLRELERVLKSGITPIKPQDEKKDLAYEIRQTLRQYRMVRQNDGFYDFSMCGYDDPLKSTDEPLPVIEGFDGKKVVPVGGYDVTKVNEYIKSMEWKRVWGEIHDLGILSGFGYSMAEIVLDSSGGIMYILLTKPVKKEI